MKRALLLVGLPASILLIWLLSASYWYELDRMYPDPPPRIPLETLLKQPFESLDSVERGAVIRHYMESKDPSFIQTARRAMVQDWSAPNETSHPKVETPAS